MLIEPTLRSDLLAGQVAIVTGGSRGIGGATSTMLAANGARVVIADVDEPKAAETVDVLNREFGDGTASAHDGSRMRRMPRAYAHRCVAQATTARLPGQEPRPLEPGRQKSR